MSLSKLINITAPTRRFLLVIAAIVLTVAGVFPFLASREASALQLGTRYLELKSAVPSATSVQYKFSFVLGTLTGTSDVEGLKFQACTTAVGTCSAPSGLSFSSGTFVSQANWQGGTNFAFDGTGANDCTASASVICANRTDSTNQTTSTAREITFGTITNPSTANSTFFVRITTYSASTYTGGSTLDTGTVASAVVQTLTVTADVAEVLHFCVGSTTVDDDSGDVTGASANDCTGVSGTNVDLGTLDTAFTNVTPVNTTNGGDDENGVAVIRSNAVNGATVYLHAIQQSGSNHLGTLRISGATCDAGTTSTDQCINAQGTTQAQFTAGTEKFGMTIAVINCSLNPDTAYTCDYATDAYNLRRDAAYDGDGGNNVPTDNDQVAGTTDAGYAWDETGTFDTIASSTGATNKVLDDEAMLLKFAASPAITTPFGAYTALADFVAVATY